jgi:hypothetical protein
LSNIGPRSHLADERLLQRIRGEFLEMPGLTLTPAQAGRLWALEPDVCASVLAQLIETGFLARSAEGRYARGGAPPVTFPPVRMTPATTDRTRQLVLARAPGRVA